MRGTHGEYRRQRRRRATCLFAAALFLAACSNDLSNGSGANDERAFTPPEIVASFPDEGSVEVPVSSQLFVEFSEPVSHATLSGLSFELAGSAPVAGSIDIADSVVAFVPDQPLDYATTYAVTVSGTVAASDGDTHAVDRSWEFTTESSPSYIYVSAAGGSDTNDGLTIGAPVRTISRAIARAGAEARPAVALGPGVYRENVELPTGIVIEGHDSAWRPAQSPDLVIIRPDSPTNDGHAIAVRSTGTSAGTGLRNLTIDAPDGIPGTNSATSYGLHLQNADTFQLINVVVRAGDGADGTDGTAGTAALQTPATGGADGWSGAVFAACNVSGRGGGAGAPGAGRGGASGTADGECGSFLTSYKPTPGKDGNAAPDTSNTTYGYGGEHGTVGEDGGAGGEGASGSDGTGGAGADEHGSVVDGFWSTAGGSGSSGATGTAGTGGGGGGGGGGFGNAPGGYTGGGGGGGGAGGVPAPAAGTGGAAGGSSFGIFAVNSTVDLQNVTVVTGNGGRGGDGGAGGAGQPGGPGGAGGAGGDGGRGGAGGTGGRGGHSGGGGGGAGGLSFGIARLSSTVSAVALQVVQQGSAGSGGAGGTAPTGESAGSAGVDGESGQTINL